MASAGETLTSDPGKQPISSSSPSTKRKIIEFLNKGLRPAEAYGQVVDEPDEETLPVIMGYLSPKMKEQARDELNETEETKETSLNALRELVSKEPNLVSRMDDNFLLQFLRARKFNVERAFKLMQNYFRFRKEYAAIYDPSDTQAVFDIILRNYLGMLKRRDKNGCAVLYMRFKEWDPDVDVFDDLFRAITAGLLFAIEDPATQVTGYRLILDTRGIKWKQLKYGTPQNAVLAIKSTQFCLPARCKAIHILSSRRLFKLAYFIVYPFLTSKLKERIHMHGEDPTSLREYVSPLVLPEEFGGQAGPLDNSDWAETLIRGEKIVRHIMEFGYR